jgi:glycosyltransferase involved in cell wall biosynthesis
MKIVIDGTQSMFPALRGVGRYTLSLIRSIIDAEHTHDISIFYNTFKKKNGYFHFPSECFVETCVSGLPGRLLTGLWNRYSFPPIDFFVGSHDVFHAPTAHLIPPTKGRLVCTIHDLIPIRFPDNCSRAYLQSYNRSLELICERADAIITVSESTKNDMGAALLRRPEIHIKTAC